MPTYSEQTLAERALRKLGVLANGQSADTADAQLVIDKMEGVLADLFNRGVYGAETVGEIPPSAFDYIADCLAMRCTDEFGVSDAKLQKLVTMNREAERMLRILNTGHPPMGPVTEAMY